MIRCRQWSQSLISAPSGANANANANMNMNMNARADLDRSQPIITWRFLSKRTDLRYRQAIGSELLLEVDLSSVLAVGQGACRGR
jgi:hypothetical protein